MSLVSVQIQCVMAEKNTGMKDLVTMNSFKFVLKNCLKIAANSCILNLCE